LNRPIRLVACKPPVHRQQAVSIPRRLEPEIVCKSSAIDLNENATEDAIGGQKK
jgi:hypothetical protein